MRRALVLLLAFLAPAAMADTAVRPFVAGSLAQMTAARQGKPFVHTFWSIGGTHFYDRARKVETVFGIAPEERLQQWVQEAL